MRTRRKRMATRWGTAGVDRRRQGGQTRKRKKEEEEDDEEVEHGEKTRIMKRMRMMRVMGRKWGDSWG